MNRRSGKWLTLAVAGSCLALGGVSLLLPFALTGDEWCWLIWGRDVGRLGLDTTACLGLHVWKPLPVLFTTAIAQTGDAAPMLWLVLVRTSWLVALVLAYRVGTRLGGRLAGVFAALGLLLIPNPDADWIGYVRHASSEPLIVAAILSAVDRHLVGHRLQALALGCLAALGRPEAWLVIVAYGAVLWREQPGRRLAIAGIVALVPLLWLGGGAWGGHGPVSAAREGGAPVAKPPARSPAHLPARSPTGTEKRPTAHGGGAAVEPPGRRRAPSRPLSAVLFVAVAAAKLVVLPIALLALAALIRALMAIHRDGSETDRVTAFLGIAALGWIAVQMCAGFLGFPVTSRFLFGPAAVISLLGGVGLVQTTMRLSGVMRMVVILASAALIAVFAAPRIEAFPAQLEGGGVGRGWPSVVAALRRAKAQGALDRCASTIYVVDVGGRRASEIPWRLDVPARAVHLVATSGTIRIERGIVVVGQHGHTGVGSRPGWRQLATAGKWSVYEVGCGTRR